MTDWAKVQSESTQVPDGLSATLERLIRDGNISHGEKLPAERDLALMLGVSRTSLRDSLRQLELKGMVDRRPGRGTVVLNPAFAGVGPDLLSKLDRSERDIREVMDLRAVIEPPITARAARRATARDIRELHAIVEKMERSSPDQAPEIDILFHQQIARATHNPLLGQLVEFASDWINESRPAAGFSDQRMKRSIAAHRRIVEAIESRDPESARQAMADHIERVIDLVIGGNDE
ncbi:MAG: FadR family transcriptional regulator [Solirubrobacterales bacterium]|nr:FadR family transcriptional regulator [Solirubrobacterales bacterium]OJU95547.1 MAG: hypothetical protein BGO23_06310 [Solirubrobacterales bacterium 67-14]